MKSKKMLAMTLAAAMVLGGSMTAFAADTGAADSATGSGTAFEHVDKDIIAVTLPTQGQVANVFNYYVDPERLINDAGTLTDGTTEVTGNTDGVYFKNTTAGTASPAVDASVKSYSIGGATAVTSGLTVTIPTTTAADLSYVGIADIGNDYAEAGWYEGTDKTTAVTVNIADDGNGSVPTPATGDTIVVEPYQAATSGSSTTSYSSSSDAVSFEGKNSVAVDVSVKAEVEATTGGKDITLVADAEALAAAETPALLMKLKVGTDEKVITSTGVTASATIAGVPANFAVTTENNKFVYKIRTNTDTDNGGTALADWNATTVQLIGKTNSANVSAEDGLTAPKIKLTWTIAKSAGTTTQAYVSATTVSTASKILTLTLPTDVTVSKVELVLGGNTTTLTSGNHYTVSGNTLNIAKYAAGWAGGTIKVTYSDNHVDTLTCE